MASAQTSDDEPQDEAVTGAPASGNGKKRRLIMAAGALALIAASSAGVWFSGLLGGTAPDEAMAEQAGAAPIFYALPEILVSLNTGERRSVFLKAKLSLELTRASDEERIQALMPRIVDYCHVYLRELRVEETRGSAGSTRLREELLRRIAAAVAPVPVRDVLFDELFVQ